MSWQTRTLAQFIAATVEIEAGKENPLATAAAEVALDKTEAQELKAATRIAADTPRENAVGSFERFMSAMPHGLAVR